MTLHSIPYGPVWNANRQWVVISPPKDNFYDWLEKEYGLHYQGAHDFACTDEAYTYFILKWS